MLHCCRTLVAHVDVVDRRLGLADILARTVQALERCDSDADSPSYPKDMLVVSAVVSLRSNRPVVIGEGLNIVFHLIIEGALSRDLLLDQVSFFSSLSALIVGKPAVWVILEALCTVMQSETLEAPIQMKAVSCVAAVASDSRLRVAGTMLVATLQSCFNLALTSPCVAVQSRSRQVLRAMLRDRVVRSVLDNRDALDATPVLMLLHEHVHRPDLEGCDPSAYLEGFDAPRQPRFVAASGEATPAPLRDIVNILGAFFRIATQVIPSSVKSPDEVEVRTRQLALDCIACIMLDFPEHAVEQEKSVLAPLLVHVEDTLWHCIGSNLATSAPSSFFVSAVHLLTIVATRAHYALLPSLRKFMERVVFPLIKSRYSTLEQKIGLLSVVRSILARPALTIAYFCNYDCLAPVQHGVGLLQFIMHSVVEVAFIDFMSSDSDAAAATATSSSSSSSTNVWVTLSGLQQSTLRCECLSLVGMFVEALWRWLETPMKRTASLVLPGATLAAAGGGGGLATTTIGGGAGVGGGVAAQMATSVIGSHTHVDPTATLHFSPPIAPSYSNVSSNTPNHASAPMTPVLGPTGTASLDRFPMLSPNAQPVPRPAPPEFGEPEIPQGVLYHWKHLHQAMVNRLVLIEARQRFDANWRNARQFLIDNKVIAPTSEAFARWIHATHGLRKGQIAAIFERMLRDTACAEICKAYVGSFDYRHQYVDESLRIMFVSLMKDESIPKFEGQVWERLMGYFAECYHAQNHDDADPACALSLEDADGMANAVFFLHSTQHNASVKDKMLPASFRRDASEMVKKRLPDEYWINLFNRVVRRPWAPEGQAVAELDAAADWRSNYWGTVPQRASSAHLWGGNMGSHSEYFASLRHAEQLQLRYIQRAAECFSNFLAACGGKAAVVRSETQMAAYCVPHYAAHVRLILRLVYPVVAVAVVLANKLCFSGPHVTLAQTLNHHVLPLMSLFGVDCADPALRANIAKLFQKMREQEHSCRTAFAGHPGMMLLAASGFV